MAHDCVLCGTTTIFYIWSTSRHFPRTKLLKALGCTSKSSISRVLEDGVPVCFGCFEKIKNFNG